MKVLIDTNVVLDAIANREPFCLYAQKIIKLILDNKIEGDKAKSSAPVISPVDFINTMSSII